MKRNTKAVAVIAGLVTFEVANAILMFTPFTGPVLGHA